MLVHFQKKQREFLQISQTLDKINLKPFRLPNTEYRLSVLKVSLNPARKVSKRLPLKDEDISKAIKTLYKGQFFLPGQTIYFEFQGQGLLA